MAAPRTITPEQIATRFDELIQWIGSVVSPFGEVEGPEERERRITACKDDLGLFIGTYFPHYARQENPEFLADLEAAIRVRNEPQMILGFRGSAKSTIVSLIDLLRDIVYKRAHFVVFVSRSREAACIEYSVPVKAELTANARLRNDFGIVAIHGEEQDFVAGETRVRAAGIKSFPRGMKHGPWRIDRIRMEDIEDRGNVLSIAMQKKYLRVITDDILQSVGAGIDEEWSAMYLANYFSKRSLTHHVRASGVFAVRTIKALRDVRKGERRPDAIDGMVSTWPARYPTAMLAEKRRSTPVTFATEWQQEPDDDESTFRREWFRFYAQSDIPPFARKFAWIDPSSGETETQDYKAYGLGYTAVINGDTHLWLGETYIRQQTINEMCRGVIELQRKHPDIQLWGYEEVAGEAYLTKLLNGLATAARVPLPLFPVMKSLPGFPWKKDRIPQMQSWLEPGFCHIVKGNDDHERLVQQYLDYPDGANDDGPDFHSGLYRLSVMLASGSVIL